MSIASAGASTGSILARMADTAPAISSDVSPRTLSAIRKPPIWAGVASPESSRSKAVAVLGQDRLRMELHAVDRRAAVRHAHHDAVVRLRGDVKIVRQGRAVDD